MAATAVGSGFGRLWVSSLLSNLSDGIRAAAFPLLAVTLTRDPMLVAGVTVAQQVPWLIAGPLAGVMVDRADRRRILWVVNTVRASIFALLAVAVVSGESPLWLLYLAAVALGVGESFYDNAAQTVVPVLIESTELERANGRLVAAEVAGNEIVGPPIGAMLFSVAVVLPFASSAAGLVVAVVLVLGLAGSFRPATIATDSSDGMWRQLTEGFRFVRRDRELATVTLLAGVLYAADAAWFAILVLYSLEVLDLSEAAFGALLAVGAVGGIIGAVSASKLASRFRLGTLLAGILLVSAVAQLVLGTTSNAALAILFIAVSSFPFGVWSVVAVSLRQRVTPSHLLGRANATYHAVSVGAAPIGAILGALAAEQWGIRAPFLIGVPALLAGALLAARRLRGNSNL
ncbi:MAG: MFS transporter [Actinomycetota bacterium]|nr:MFS transporter [Actinomycetota bacterium]